MITSIPSLSLSRSSRSSIKSIISTNGILLPRPRTSVKITTTPTVTSTAVTPSSKTKRRSSSSLSSSLFMLNNEKYQPVHVSPSFLIKVWASQFAIICGAGIIVALVTGQPWYVVPLSVYVCDIMGWCTHMLGHQKFTGPWYSAHMGHHLKDYPPQRFLSSAYIAAKVNNSPVYLPTAVLTPFVVCALCQIPLTFAAWLCSEAATVVALHLSNLFHQAYHIRNHPYERWPWFHKLRALHYWHHKGNMHHNYAISDFVLDRIHGSLLRSPTEYRRRQLGQLRSIHSLNQAFH